MFIINEVAGQPVTEGNCPHMCSGHGRCDKFARYTVFVLVIMEFFLIITRCYISFINNNLKGVLVTMDTKQLTAQNGYALSVEHGATRR